VDQVVVVQAIPPQVQVLLVRVMLVVLVFIAVVFLVAVAAENVRLVVMLRIFMRAMEGQEKHHQ
jgi:hypothetical protein